LGDRYICRRGGFLCGLVYQSDYIVFSSGVRSDIRNMNDLPPNTSLEPTGITPSVFASDFSGFMGWVPGGSVLGR
jgi:hypothetical protein